MPLTQKRQLHSTLGYHQSLWFLNHLGNQNNPDILDNPDIQNLQHFHYLGQKNPGIPGPLRIQSFLGNPGNLKNHHNPEDQMNQQNLESQIDPEIQNILQNLAILENPENLVTHYRQLHHQVDLGNLENLAGLVGQPYIL
jgi:hypothetical protein